MNTIRYSRQTILEEVGFEGQEKLSKTSVLIIGCGGLGIPAALNLAGAGIGTMHLVDFDRIELSNLHRQVIYQEADIGRSKVDILCGHLQGLNSEINVLGHNVKLTGLNAVDLIKNVDYVLDCSDNLVCRYLINDACVKLDKPFVSASIYKYEGQLGLFNYKNGATYRCLYNVDPEKTKLTSCEAGGVLGTLPSTLGALQANELLKVVLELKNILIDKVLIFNSLSYNTSYYNIEKNIELYQDIKSNSHELSDSNARDFNIELSEQDLEKVVSQENVVFVDVRELNEEPKIQLPNLIQMPVSEALLTQDKLDTRKNYVCFCQSGVRSLNSAIELRKRGLKAFSVVGGISSLNTHCLTLNEQEITS